MSDLEIGFALGVIVTMACVVVTILLVGPPMPL